MTCTLKKRRDALVAPGQTHAIATAPKLTKKQLREWAQEQFAQLDDLATQTEVDLADRQLVESFAQRIEINPEKNTGTIFLQADLQAAFASTRVVGGDDAGRRASGPRWGSGCFWGTRQQELRHSG